MADEDDKRAASEAKTPEPVLRPERRRQPRRSHDADALAAWEGGASFADEDEPGDDEGPPEPPPDSDDLVLDVSDDAPALPDLGPAPASEASTDVAARPPELDLVFDDFAEAPTPPPVRPRAPAPLRQAPGSTDEEFDISTAPPLAPSTPVPEPPTVGPVRPAPVPEPPTLGPDLLGQRVARPAEPDHAADPFSAPLPPLAAAPALTVETLGLRPRASNFSAEAIARGVAEAVSARSLVEGEAPPAEVWQAQLGLHTAELGAGARGDVNAEPVGPAARARSAVAAARAAERLGHAEALRFYHQARATDPRSLAALRGILRLSARAGAWDDAIAAAEALAAALPEERAAYLGLCEEARGLVEEAPSEPSSPGVVALLHEAEAALGRGLGPAAAAPLARFARALGGEAGLALGAFAAMLTEGISEPAAPTESSALAAGFARLRQALFAAPSAAAADLEAAAGALPRSPLSPALLALAAERARTGGDRRRAADLLARAHAAGARFLSVREGVDLASDDLLVRGDGAALPARPELAARLAALPAAAAALLAARLAAPLAAIGRERDAIALLAAAAERDPGSGPALATVLAQILAADPDPGLAAEVRAFVAAWDPGRRGEAALTDTLLALRREGARRAPERLAALAARAGVDTALGPAPDQIPPARDPGLALALAWELAAAARPEEAARALLAAATAWRTATPPELAAALRARAGLLTATADPAAYLGNLPAPRFAEPDDDDPGVLARTLAAETSDARGIASRFAAAAAVSLSPHRIFEAVGWWIQAGAFNEALALLHAAPPEASGDEIGQRLLRRLARLGDDPIVAAELLRQRAAAAASLADTALYEQLAAETLERAGRRGEAASIYRELLAGPLAKDADLALRRTLLALRDSDGLLDFWRDEFDASSGAGKDRAAAAASIEKARIALDLLEDRVMAAGEISTALALDPDSLPARVLALGQPGVLIGADARIGELERLARDMGSLRAPTLFFAGLVADGEGEAEAARRLFRQAARGIFGPTPIVLLRRWLLAEETAAAPAADLADTLVGGAAELGQTPGADPRLATALYLRAAEVAERGGDFTRAEALIQRALGVEPGDLPGLVRLYRLQERRGDDAAAVVTLEAQAAAMREPARKASVLYAAGVIAADRLGDTARARALFARVLELHPLHEGAFARQKHLIEASGDGAALAALLGRRAQSATPDQAVWLRLERAVLLAHRLGDRAAAKRELSAVLEADPNHLGALAALANLELEDGDPTLAAELSERQAGQESDPERLVECYLRLGRLYQGPLADLPRAVAAYERALALDDSRLETLGALAELYARAGESQRGISVSERLLELETDPVRRRPHLVRLGTLWEGAGDVRRAGIALRKAAGESPRDLQVIGELVRFYDRHKDVAARNLLLDGAIGGFREDVRLRRDPLGALRMLIPLFRFRERHAAARAAAQLLLRLSPDESERAEVTAFIASVAPARRSLAELRAEEDDFPRELPHGLGHVLRLIGPGLARASKPDLRRVGVGRNDRAGRGTPLRTAFEAVAIELGVPDFDIYVSSTLRHALSVEPGDPPAIVVGAGIAELGTAAVRFVAGFTLRLAQTHFDLFLREGPIEAAALIAGLVRQFVPEHRPPYLPEAVLKTAEARVGRAMTRALRPALAPLAVQLGAGCSPEELFTAAQELGARAGLLACGDLAVALDVLAAYAGRSQAPFPALFELPLVSHLVEWALSDEYDALSSG